jgi:PAS domain S-box-containing protein
VRRLVTAGGVAVVAGLVLRRLPAPAWAQLLVVPVFLAYATWIAWQQVVRDRDRMRTLYRAGRALDGPLDATTFAPFLALVERLFRARAAELAVADGDVVTVHDRSGVRSLLMAAEDGEGRDPIDHVPPRDGIEPAVALVGNPGDAWAALALYRTERLTQSERALLDALGSQVRARLVNLRLYAETAAQRAQLSDIIEHTSDGIFVLSPRGVIESWNPVMERLTGVDAGQAVGEPWFGLFGQDAGGPGDAAETEADVDVLMVGPDGSERWIRYNRSPIREGDGALRGEVVVARDVTTELQADRMKSDFVATVSHELRTPLTPLKGFLATLLSGTGDDDPDSRRRAYRIMRHQVDRLERLTSDLLEVSRIEGDRVPVETRITELTAVVREQVADFRQHRPDRAIELQAPGAVHVQADPFRVGQVVSNLLSNALKYSEGPEPVVVTVSGGDLEPAVVSVRDRGEGIAPPEQSRVFDRFHRVEGHLTRTTGGTGLGLYIAKRLVEAMHGRMWLTSRPGTGSTFSFSLPAVAPPGIDADGPAGAGAPLAEAEPPVR